MATYNWTSGDSGSWGTAGNWLQDSVPNSTTAEVTIASATDIGVTIAAAKTFTADSVTLDSTGVTLDVAGLLRLGGAADQLILNAGTLDVASAGTIANGTIIAGGVHSLPAILTMHPSPTCSICRRSLAICRPLPMPALCSPGCKLGNLPISLTMISHLFCLRDIEAAPGDWTIAPEAEVSIMTHQIAQVVDPVA